MFHPICDKQFKLSDGKKRAEGGQETSGVWKSLANWWWGAEQPTQVLISAERLRPGERFAVELELEGVKKWGTPFSVGVTGDDPDQRSQLPASASDLRPSWVVRGNVRLKDGKKVGKWEDNLELRPGTRETVGVTWMDGNVMISYKSRELIVFSGVPGPLWAVLDVTRARSKLSALPPVQKRLPKKKAEKSTASLTDESEVYNKQRDLYAKNRRTRVATAYENVSLAQTPPRKGDKNTVSLADDPKEYHDENLYANLLEIQSGQVASVDEDECEDELNITIKADRCFISETAPTEEHAPPLPVLKKPKEATPSSANPDSAKKKTKGLPDQETQAQYVKASPVPPRKPVTGTLPCPKWLICDRYIGTLRLSESFFEPQYDQCFCLDCHGSRGDDLSYPRGDPPKKYGLPVGWCRFGLSVTGAGKAKGVTRKWHAAFHGTTTNNIQPILESESLLMPGDENIDGKEIRPPPGHFNDERKPKGFDINQVFVSPSIKYAGHPAYAKPKSWTDPHTENKYNVQVAIQVKIKPGSYKVGPQTVARGDEILDELFDNDELEWSTRSRGAISFTGLLVKI